MADLPTVTSPLPRDLQQFVQRVREALDGSGPDAVITARALIATGLVTSGTGGGVAPIVGTIQAPRAPTSLTASGALASVIVAWSGPAYTGHAYTEVWAHTSDIIGDAQLVGMTAGNNFSHNIGGTAARYYWARNVNQNGVVSAFNATNGVQGSTGTDPSYLLSVLTSAITSSQLHSDLGTRINLIDGSASLSGSVAHTVAQEALARTAAIAAEATARTGAITTAISGEVSARNTAIAVETAARTSSVNVLTASIADLTGTSAYNNSTSYSTNDLVTYSNNLYKAKQSTTGNLPTNTTFWDLVGNYSSINQVAVANAAAVSSLDSRVTAAEGSLTTASSDITSLTTNLATSNSNITANGTAITGLDTRVTATEASVSTNSSDINSLTASLTNTNTSVSGNATAINSLDTRVTAAESTVTASASSLTALSTTVGDNTTAITTNATSINGVEGKYAVKIDAAGHVSGYGLISTVNNATPTSEFGVRADNFWISPPSNSSASAPTSGLYKGYVWYDTTNNVTKYYTGTSFSTNPQTVPFAVLTSAGSINGVTVPAGVYMDTAMIANATITNAQINSLTADKITASLLNTVDFFGNKIAGSTIFLGGSVNYNQTDGVNSSIASVTDPNVTMDSNGATFKVGAFKISNGSSDETPFQVVGGAVRINTATITDGTITNAKIGDIIHSSAYSAGSAGWKIDKTGSAEFNDATFRGTLDVGGSSGSRLTISSTKIEVYDGSTLRVKIGDLS